MDEIISRDANNITVGAGISDDADQEISMLRVDPITHYLLVDIASTPSAPVATATEIASRDENYRTVCMGWDETNGVLQEILTDDNGYLLCDIDFI